MRTLGPVFRAVNARTRQVYSLLLKDVPHALAEEFLRRAEERRRQTICTEDIASNKNAAR